VLRVTDLRRVSHVARAAGLDVERGPVRGDAPGYPRRPRVWPLLHGARTRRGGEPAVLHSCAAVRLHGRHAPRPHPHALDGTRPYRVARYRRRRTSRRPRGRGAGRTAGPRVVHGRAGTARAAPRLRRVVADARARMAALRYAARRDGGVHAPDRGRRVVRIPGDGVESAARRAARRRPHRLRAVAAPPPHARATHRRGAGRPWRERGGRALCHASRLDVDDAGPELADPRRADPVRARLWPRPVARSDGAAHAWPAPRRRRLFPLPRPDAAAGPDPRRLSSAQERAAAVSSRAVAVGPPPLTRVNSSRPTTKNSPTATTIAARWLPESSQDTLPNTSGPKIAPVLPTSE